MARTGLSSSTHRIVKPCPTPPKHRRSVGRSMDNAQFSSARRREIFSLPKVVTLLADAQVAPWPDGFSGVGCVRSAQEWNRSFGTCVLWQRGDFPRTPCRQALPLRRHKVATESPPQPWRWGQPCVYGLERPKFRPPQPVRSAPLTCRRPTTCDASLVERVIASPTACF